MSFKAKLKYVTTGAMVSVQQIDERIFATEKELPALGGIWECTDGRYAWYFQFTNPMPVVTYSQTRKCPDDCTTRAKKIKVLRELLEDGKVIVTSEESLSNGEALIRSASILIPTLEDVDARQGART